MQKTLVNDVHVTREEVLITPKQLKDELPVAAAVLENVRQWRSTIADIIHRRAPRLLVVVGPCSIHDLDAAREYAHKLKKLHDELKDSLFIVMRVYFEKPRTTVGWKGLINDPDINGTFDLPRGLRIARGLCGWIAELGLPAATEALDPISPQYLSELFAWSAIGARTTESQTHREMASGLSMPVGFKNGTDGNLDTAINALKAAAQPHRFMGINPDGQVAVIYTQGNPDGHVILRGGKAPNYDSVNIALCEEALTKAKLPHNLVVDCSHGNSNKDYRRQPLVADNVTHQILDGNRSIIGIMLESHLVEGNQNAEQPREQMCYGQSITDACINWESTETLLRRMAAELKDALPKRLA